MSNDQSKQQAGNSQNRNIFGTTHENEFLQSFVRIDLGKDDREEKGGNKRRRQLWLARFFYNNIISSFCY